MPKILFLLCFLFSFNAFAQDVIISKMEKIVDNNDKELVQIQDTTGAQYLGELEIGGFTNDDALMFVNVYNKAKQLGANAYQWRSVVDIDGSSKAFDPNHYFLSLYYKDEKKSEEEKNVAYIIGSPKKSLNISLNGKKIALPARSYFKINLEPGMVYTVSTRKFLGSSIKLSASENQPANYFQIEGFGAKSSPNFKPGINFKSGDIILLEKSFGSFLSTIYQQKDF